MIGDTGEGDASQHVLRDQLLTVAAGADVRFVVVSSDVVYPSGSMDDYEAKFWLPFKGITRPVYAIPGNHDWYDALEAFAATFLQPEAARASIRARVEADLRVTSTTDARIEHLIDEAGRLREAYGVPTGFQRAPFFEIQTDRFALVAIDTGVLQSIDPAQAEWLEGALQRSAGKLTMAIVGHPFFAGGHDATWAGGAFARLKQLLLRHGVTIVMAGDKHDLEYYVQPGRTALRHRALLRQWRWRRISQPGHRARLAGAAADRRLGVLPDPRRGGGQDRGTNPLVEAAGLVVDAVFRCVAVRRRVALRRVRLQRRAVFSELRRGQGGTVRESRSSHPVRGAWTLDLGRSGVLTGSQDRDRKRSRARRVGRSDALRHDSALTTPNQFDARRRRDTSRQRHRRRRRVGAQPADVGG